MTSLTFQGPSAYQLIGTNGSPYRQTIQNTGGTTLYFGDSPAVTPNNYLHSIGPNGHIIWEADTPCYVVPNGNGFGSVAFGPFGLELNTGIVNVNTGAAVLSTFTGLAPRNVITQIFDSGTDAAVLNPYQTLCIGISAPLGGAATTIDYMTVLIEWLTMDGIVIGIDQPIMHTYGVLNYQVPIRSPRVRVSLAVSGMPGSQSYNQGLVTIAATAAALPRYYYQSPPSTNNNINFLINDLQDNSASGHYGFDGTIQAAGTAYNFLPSTSGAAVLWFDIPNANATTAILASASRDTFHPTAGRLFFSATSAVTIVNNTPLVLPEAPLLMTLAALAGNRVIYTLNTELP